MYSPYVFLHIPKTAGTTLNSVLDKNFDPDRVLDVYTREQQAALGELTYEELEGYDLIRGHLFVYDYAQLLDGPVRFKVFTFLRDPIERVVSEYSFLKNWPKSQLYDYLNRNNVSLAQYVSSQEGVLRQRGCNCMVNSLSGSGAANLDEGLELAWHHVKDRFMAFGILERFDESLLLLRRAMDLQSTFYVRQNVRSANEGLTVTPAEYELICEHNRYDLLLYERAQAEFSRRVEALGGDFRKSLLAFNRINSRLQRMTALLDRSRGGATQDCANFK